MKKIICLLLIVSLSVSTLVSCTSAKSTPVFTLGEYSISDNEYKYWISYYKTSFFSMFAEAGYVDADNYSEEFWLTSSEGETLGELTVNQVDNSLKQLLVCQKLYDDYGLGAINDNDTQIDSAVKEKIDDNAKQIGSRNALNAALGTYGLNINNLSDIYKAEFRRALVLEYLYGDEGTEKVTNEEIESYYKENYNRVKHIYLDLNEKYVLNEDGEKVMNPSTGYYRTEELTDEEKTEKRTLGNSLLESAKNGEDFDKLIEKYGEDESMTYYTDGLYITSEDTYEEAFLNAVLEMEVGEVRLVESSMGLHIIKKFELEDAAYEKEINENFFDGLSDTIREKKQNEKLNSYLSLVTTDNEAYSSVVFSEVSRMDDSLFALGQSDS